MFLQDLPFSCLKDAWEKIHFLNVSFPVTSCKVLSHMEKNPQLFGSIHPLVLHRIVSERRKYEIDEVRSILNISSYFLSYSKMSYIKQYMGSSFRSFASYFTTKSILPYQASLFNFWVTACSMTDKRKTVENVVLIIPFLLLSV